MKASKPVYSNDTKAPRMKKGRFSKTVVTRELYSNFIKDFPEHKLTFKQFMNYWAHIAQTIREEVVNNPLGVKLGSYTGELKLQYLPYKFLANDRDASAELEEKVNHVNIMTKGKVARVKWERRWAVKFNKVLQFYAFDPVRTITADAKKSIDNDPSKFRMARNTLGGHSIWRQLKNND